LRSSRTRSLEPGREEPDQVIEQIVQGADETSALDPRLRVRGVRGLRVVDTSVAPTMVSGNCSAPTMALGWHAAKAILADR
jgi:choline dehydrogenase-like flavoprotein